MARLDAYVLHSNYDTSDEGQARKRERDKRLLALDLEDRPDHPFVLFNLGMTSHYLGEHEEAITWLQKSIAKAGPNESHVRKAYSMLGSSLRALGRNNEAKETFMEGLTAVGADPEIQFYLAQMAADAGNHVEAIWRYESVFAANLDGTFSSFDRGILGYKTLHNLALSLVATNRYMDAANAWRQALNGQYRPEIAAMFGSAALRFRDHETVKELLHRSESAGALNIWAMLANETCESLGIPFEAIAFAKLNRHPNDAALRLVVAEALLNQGRGEDALPHLFWLNERAIPQGAFFLGALSEEHGQSDKALSWYKRAHELDPSHEETTKRVQRLEGTVSQ